MLSMHRSKVAGQKINRSTATTLKSCNSNFSNPEIDCLVLKLNSMTDQFADNTQNPLNMVEWRRTKYWPTQSQNRLRIQNEVSLKKASKISIRPRVKPIKRQSKSMEINRELSIPYKQHYEKIVEEFKQKQDYYYESEEQQKNVPMIPSSTNSKRFKYYQSVKKYKKVASFIEQKILENKEMKQKSKLQPTTHQIYSSYKKKSASVDGSSEKMKSLDKTRALVNFSDEQSLLKISSMMKKWKPCQIVEKKFKESDVNKYKPKRYSMKNVKIPSELPLQTPRTAKISNSVVSSPSKGRESELLEK